MPILALIAGAAVLYLVLAGHKGTLSADGKFLTHQDGGQAWSEFTDAGRLDAHNHFAHTTIVNSTEGEHGEFVLELMPLDQSAFSVTPDTNAQLATQLADLTHKWRVWVDTGESSIVLWPQMDSVSAGVVMQAPMALLTDSTRGWKA